MKKILLITVLLFISPFIYAQKCEAYRTKTDPITEVTEEAWGWKIGSLMTNERDKECNIKLLVTKDSENDNKLYAALEVIHQVATSRMVNFDPIFENNGSFVLKTENSIIKVPITIINKGNSNHLGIYSVTNQLIGELTKDDIQKLATETLLMYQAKSSNGYSVEGKVSKKRSRNFKEQMNCFLKEI
ncbi:hypothetical protein POV26_12225 [Aequorivita todarodis]|uniref:hypothetical protein n=1 Tax=Aequorivita todarodis TaxID=2036821 RepID=UPI002350A150|nr:hypothetical protein [Aequorivita todarodis]MDC8001806.1 hypothetical protein [Aequorivita todarodis]